MQRDAPGRYVTIATAGERVAAFVPAPLPPEPPIAWSAALRRRFDDALVALGRLDAAVKFLPDAALLLYSFVRKEAVLSSMIEGTQSSLADLLLYELDEAPGTPVADAREASNCVAALEHGLARLAGGFPLSLRLLREMHGVLLSAGRGAHATPGEYRRSQVWIGGTRPGNAAFVPPPADAVPDCLRDLERFLHDIPAPTPPLLKAALAHVQFETIHPFLDGNGRIGRLLITLGLCSDGLLRAPLVYPSLYFKEHRGDYYALLDGVRRTGDWEAWLEFFADAIVAAATSAEDAALRLTSTAAAHSAWAPVLGRAARSARILLNAFARRPIATAALLAQMTGLTPLTVNRTLSRMVSAGLVAEVTGRRRNRVFSYVAFVAILGEGMELPGAARR